MTIPSAASLAHRARIAAQISPLRRIRPRVPFYELAAHRTPTLWTLYRGLLRGAPSDNIRFRVRMLFRCNQHLTSPAKTREWLQLGHKFLAIFAQADVGDIYFRAVLERYSRLIAVRREKAQWKLLARQEAEYLRLRARRPILTGAILRSSAYNTAMPRMRPQPTKLSAMIHDRRIAHSRRIERLGQLDEDRYNLNAEKQFENALARTLSDKHNDSFRGVYSSPDNWEEWDAELRTRRDVIEAGFKLENARASTPPSDDVIKTAHAARIARIAYHTRMLDHERRGEITSRAARRRRQAPPAHILNGMSLERRKIDQVIRSVSEVGYVGMVKARLGVRMKDPTKWQRAECGSTSLKERLDREMAAIYQENAQREKAATSSIAIDIMIGQHSIKSSQ